MRYDIHSLYTHFVQIESINNHMHELTILICAKEKAKEPTGQLLSVQACQNIVWEPNSGGEVR